MVSGLLGKQVPSNGLRVRPPWAPLMTNFILASKDSVMQCCIMCGRDTECKNGVCLHCKGRSPKGKGERHTLSALTMGGDPYRDEDDHEEDWSSSQRYHGSGRDDI